MQFVVNIPADFSRDLLRGERPALLVEADATDPDRHRQRDCGRQPLAQTVLEHDLNGPLADLAPTAGAFEVRVHRAYNPEAITQYNIVPGLMGVILTMTMVMMTGLAITRERERGTMENLLATPATRARSDDRQDRALHRDRADPGHADPDAGAMSCSTCRCSAATAILYLSVLLFIAANLTLGLTISSVAGNQLQAMQMTFFFFLPSILLSGFMFPFRGMPDWAQVIGQALPLTHFLRIIRGMLLKGNGWSEIMPEAWPIAVFMLVVIAIGLRFFRSTLD